LIEFTETEVFNFHGALRGARNSWESHDRSDSYMDFPSGNPDFVIGSNDHTLLMKLANAGASHAKWLRQVLVCVDINAPLYWWKEFDQYKVGTVTNSESTMHTLQRKELSEDLFALDEPVSVPNYHLEILDMVEKLRKEYLRTKDRVIWKYLIQLLPSGWMQKRTTTMNYAVIRNAYHDRKNHRLTEWHDFCRWAESLPYSEFITGRK
jgi:hypothetical protein